MCAAVSVPLAVPFAMPVATAQPCPDIEVIFARGTGAPAGLGWLGDEFVESLRGKVGDRTVGAYAVNYPASFDFDTSAPAGARRSKPTHLPTSSRVSPRRYTKSCAPWAIT